MGFDLHNDARPGGLDPAANLDLCPACASRLVYPMDWTAVGTCHWRVELRCPECVWTGAGLYEQAVLDRFDEILDAGVDSLLDDLRRLQRSNMEAELQRFVGALDSGLLTPDDFYRRGRYE